MEITLMFSHLSDQMQFFVQPEVTSIFWAFGHLSTRVLMTYLGTEMATFLQLTPLNPPPNSGTTSGVGPAPLPPGGLDIVSVEAALQQFLEAGLAPST